MVIIQIPLKCLHKGYILTAIYSDHRPWSNFDCWRFWPLDYSVAYFNVPEFINTFADWILHMLENISKYSTGNVSSFLLICMTVLHLILLFESHVKNSANDQKQQIILLIWYLWWLCLPILVFFFCLPIFLWWQPLIQEKFQSFMLFARWLTCLVLCL